MIAGTTLTSLRTFAVIKTALKVGNVALDTQITGAFPNGYSAMVKMIAATDLTNLTKIVRLVKKKEIFDAEIGDVFLSKY